MKTALILLLTSPVWIPAGIAAGVGLGLTFYVAAVVALVRR
jgi:hypothetical protein